VYLLDRYLLTVRRVTSTCACSLDRVRPAKSGETRADEFLRAQDTP